MQYRYKILLHSNIRNIPVMVFQRGYLVCQSTWFFIQWVPLLFLKRIFLVELRARTVLFFHFFVRWKSMASHAYMCGQNKSSALYERWATTVRLKVEFLKQFGGAGNSMRYQKFPALLLGLAVENSLKSPLLFEIEE